MIVIIGIVIIIATCLNFYLWKRRPHDGEIVVTTDRNGKKTFSLELERTPEEIEKMKRISFKVVSHESDNEVLQLKVDYSEDFAD